MCKCVQCNEPADIHIHWIADEKQNDADICNACMDKLWNGAHGFKHTEFGHSLIITPCN